MLSRKAVSPIIATVLLVAITVSAAGGIYYWAKGFIGEQVTKFGQPAHVVCADVKFTASISKDTSVTPWIYPVIINNQGNVKIYQIVVRLTKEGTTIEQAVTPSQPIEEGATVQFTLEPSKFGKDPLIFEGAGTEFDLIPVLLGKGATTGQTKLFGCEEQAVKGLKATIL